MNAGMEVWVIGLVLCGTLALLIPLLWIGLRQRRSRGAVPNAAGVRLGAQAGVATPAVAISLPASLGPYRIDRALGQGAMGMVYLGHDIATGRTAALKSMALSQEFAPEQIDEARSRFFWEAETAARLHHPGIVDVFGSGDDQGVVWIAMEFIDGQALSEWTQPERLLSLPAALAVVRQCALALDYAHRQSVVHRDIKPANVLYNPDSGKAKLMDFGVARLTDAQRTRTGRVLGTPAFMSPEQLAGQHIDARSDLFSLGVMLYQLVTGQLPFVADSLGELMYAITQREPQDPRIHKPLLPAAIAVIIMKSLQKEVANRFQTGAQFALALARVEAVLKRKISHV